MLIFEKNVYMCDVKADTVSIHTMSLSYNIFLAYNNSVYIFDLYNTKDIRYLYVYNWLIVKDICK